MVLHKNTKLFFVEFGTPNLNHFSSASDPQFYVLATGYDDAGNKAIEHLKNDVSIKEVLAYDGSLNPFAVKEESLPKIKSIRLVSEILLF